MSFIIEKAQTSGYWGARMPWDNKNNWLAFLNELFGSHAFENIQSSGQYALMVVGLTVIVERQS